MITNMSEADSEMAELFRQAWEVTAGYKCDWPNIKVADHLAGETWARWNLDYFDGRQVSLVGPDRQRKFSKEGLIFINVFTPLGAGLNNARDASQIALFAYEGKRTPSDVWFRDVRIASEGHGQGSGRNKSWWTTLVVARFTYEHLR
jgi:hypothetical protein